MAIDFPSSPTVGQTYTFGGRTWQYNAQGGWQRIPLNLLMNNAPAGRLTLTSGVPVLTSTVSSASTIYYTPYDGNQVPIYDGTNWVMTSFSELSQTLADTTKSPAATVQDAAYDMFVWNDGGTMRCTRGPAWLQTASVTATSATPCVVTWTGHPLHDASPFYFASGTPPTGLALNTIYYITVVDANSFKLSSSVANQVAGTFLASSSTGSSLVGGSIDTGRGTGAGTSELTRVNGILMNANAITNGPGAQRGTYVGTIRTDPTNNCAFQFGTIAASGGAGKLYVWNMYNRVSVVSLAGDSTDTWTYTTTAWRAANASSSIRTSYIVGVSEEVVDAVYTIALAASTNGAKTGIGADTVLAFTGVTGDQTGTNGVATSAFCRITPAIGWHYLSAIEFAFGATPTFNGDGGTPASLQSGIYVTLRM